MLKAGFYEKEITPPLGDYIPGYAGPRDSTSIHDPLYTRAVAIRTGEAVYECVIMITVDLVMVHPNIYDLVMDKVEKWTGVPQKNIMIAATHSHTAGPVYGDGEFSRSDSAWLEMTSHSAADAAIMAYQRMEDASAKYASKTVEGIAFCRDYYMKNGEIRTNPRWQDPSIDRVVTENDNEFPVLFFFDKDSKPMGAITNFTCHHDSKAGTEISADYSGVLADRMKDEFGRDFVNILFQGLCGNVNHCNPFREKFRRDEPAYLTIGKRLADAEKELFNTAEDFPIDAVYSEKRVVPVPKRDIPFEAVEEHEWVLKNVPIDWYQMNIGKPENLMFKRTHAVGVISQYKADKYIPAYVQTIRLGDMYIYALSGEPYVQFSFLLKEKSPTKYTMISGTAARGLFAYIPTDDIFETTSYASAYGSCRVNPGAGELLVNKAIELAIDIDEQAKNHI